jgi:hypothetical protein
MTMNAFDPAYVQTHMPEFMANFRRESHAITEGKKAAARPRKTRESAGQQQAAPLSSFPKTKKASINLEPRQYYTFSKAGAK